MNWPVVLRLGSSSLSHTGATANITISRLLCRYLNAGALSNGLVLNLRINICSMWSFLLFSDNAGEFN